MGGPVRVTWAGREASLGFSSLQDLTQAVTAAFAPGLDGQAFGLSTSSSLLRCDEDLQGLQGGEVLFVVSIEDHSLIGGHVKERINFVPHPKTMTHAGDYEYFADQGQHPLPYAIAELVDNSLQATRHNQDLGRERAINISFLAGPRGRGCISVTDNGQGMTGRELNQWAVMNLAVSDRQQKGQESAEQPRQSTRQAPKMLPAERYLSAELSHFGVGCKNAAFFAGREVKVVTKTKACALVHELCLRAESLEQRYRDNKPVYEEDLVHRNPGDASTLTELEGMFGAVSSWVEQEAAGPESFTRVVIGDLKDDVCQLLMDDEQSTRMCNELAHVYHYYLHGATGNRRGAQQGAKQTLPDGQLRPKITVEFVHCQKDAFRVLWSRDLSEVDTDMESLYLTKKKTEFPFSLHVQDKGPVDGILYYFPYEDGRETLPDDHSLMKHSANVFTLTQQQLVGDGARQTQQGRLSSSQEGLAQGAPLLPAECLQDCTEESPSLARGPVLATFWQGRLIPATRIESLPFIESTRAKRTASGRDTLPDEVFKRLRGALFFGPSFKVTRNKLNFRDNLTELLAAALPNDRALERRFKEWLSAAHRDLDKNIRFENMASSQEQAVARRTAGENVTIFHSVSDASRAICSGNVVRLATRPIVVGRVIHFQVGKVVHAEGCYSNGLVRVAPLPSEIHGEGTTFTHQLRRVEAVLSETEAEEFCCRELAKMPSSLSMEPMKLSAGESLVLDAGTGLPEISVNVLSRAGAKLTATYTASQRQPLTVTQELRFMGSVDFDPPTSVREASKENTTQGQGTQSEGGKGASRRRRGSGRSSKADEGPAEGSAEDCQGQVVLSRTNTRPNKDAFVFLKVLAELQKAGSYRLHHRVHPTPQGAEALVQSVALRVVPGPPASLELKGEGRLFVAENEMHLGEPMPPVMLSVQDAFGNPTGLGDLAEDELQRSLQLTAAFPSRGTEFKPIPDILVEFTCQKVQGGILLRDITFLGAEGATWGLSIFECDRGIGLSQRSTVACTQGSLGSQSASLKTADVVLRVQVVGIESLEGETTVLDVMLRPGLPAQMELLPGHPFDEAGAHASPSTDAVTPCLRMLAGDCVPSFSIQLKDRWNNPTGPSKRLHTSVRAECSALDDLEAPKLEVSETTGVCRVAGLRTAADAEGKCQLLLTAIASSLEPGGLQASLALDQPPALWCHLELDQQPAPSHIGLFLEGTPLEHLEDKGQDCECVFRAAGLVAGATVSGLQLAVLDQQGNLYAKQVKGKVTCSWVKGSQKALWQSMDGGAQGESSEHGDRLIGLSPLQAPECVSEATRCWVRMTLDKAAGGAVLEAEVELTSVSGPPATWGISVVGTGLTTQDGADLCSIVAGETCNLEVEPLDEFHNPCQRQQGDKIELPTPLVTLESDSPGLVYDPSEWKQGWSTSQATCTVYCLSIVVGGPPGPIRLVVRDEAGEGGSSSLTEDSLSLELKEGPPAKLIVAGSWRLLGGLQAMLHNLTVQACDTYGNISDSASIEVTLNPSALSREDSAAASVQAVGGNRVKLKKGLATYENVKISAKTPGKYTLSVASGSRKVSLQPAELEIELAQANRVQKLLMEREGEAQVVAGDRVAFSVVLEAEDGKPVPMDTVRQALCLHLVASGDQRSELMLEPLLDDFTGPLNCVKFLSDPLEVAGEYTATAEFREHRESVLHGAQRADGLVRSSTASINVIPGTAADVTLESQGGHGRDMMSVSNGSEPSHRLLLPGAAFQARDMYGNPACGDGILLRLVLHASNSQEDAEIPSLECELASGEQMPLDCNGRLFLGDISVAEGSGSAHSSSGVIDLELALEASGLKGKAGWETAWTAQVLFSDDAARYARLQELTSRRAVVSARLAQLDNQREDALEQLQSLGAQRETLVAKVELLQTRAGLSADTTLAKAEGRLEELKTELQAASSSAGPARPARYGVPRDSRGRPSATYDALEHCLAASDPGVVGVMAALATVEEEAIARTLSASVGNSLGTLVLEDADTRRRLSERLRKAKKRRCDMLALSMVNAWRSETGDVTSGSRNVSQLAARLHHEASTGSDPALCLRLPHSKPLERQGNPAPYPSAPSGELHAADWPPGFVGFAVNLLRPTRTGTRGSCLYAILSGMMLFETLEQAEEYRTLVCSRLRSACGPIATLDLNLISGQGIIKELPYKTTDPLDKFPYVFGSAPAGERPAVKLAEAGVAALRELVPVMRDAAELEAQVQAAEAETREGTLQERAEVGGLEEELHEIDQELEANEAVPKAPTGNSKPRAKRGFGSKADGGRQRKSSRLATSEPDPCEEIRDSDIAVATTSAEVVPAGSAPQCSGSAAGGHLGTPPGASCPKSRASKRKRRQ